MKKVLKAVFFCFAFTTATFFMSCSNAIPEDDCQSFDKSEDEKSCSEEEVFDSGRHCLGGRNGQGGHSISDCSYSNRRDRNSSNTRNR